MFKLRQVAAMAITIALAAIALPTPAAASLCRYVAYGYDHSIAVVDDDTSNETVRIPVGGWPLNVAVSPDGQRVYVVNWAHPAESSISVIDTATNAVIDTILVGSEAIDVAVSPDSTRLYVVAGYSPAVFSNILVVDTTTSAVLQRIPSRGADPGHRITLSPDGRTAYVAKPDISVVSVVDVVAGSIVADIHFQDVPVDVAVSDDGALAYIRLRIRSGTGGYSARPDYFMALDTATRAVVGTVPNFEAESLAWNAQATGAVPNGCWGGLNTPTPTATPTITPTGTPTLTTVPTAVRVPTHTPAASPTVATRWEYLYVANAHLDTVSVVNATTGAVVATVSVGPSPTGVAVTPDGAFAYVTNAYNGTVSVISTATSAVIATIGGLSGVNDVVVAPDGRTAYVAERSNSAVAVIDTATNQIIARVELGDVGEDTSGSWYGYRPHVRPWKGYLQLGGMAIAPDGSSLYVAGLDPYFSGHAAVFVIDTATKTADTMLLTDGGVPTGVAVSPDGARVYVTHGAYDSVALSVIDTATRRLAASVPLVGSTGIAVSPDSTTAYITTLAGVYVMNTASYAFTLIPGGEEPTAVVLSRDGARAYVTNARSYTVSVIDTATHTVTATIPGMARPLGLAIASVGQPIPTATPTPIPARAETQECAYVLTYSGVSVINTATRRKVAVIPNRWYSAGITVTADGRAAYVANQSSNDVSLIDTSAQSVVARIPVDRGPSEIACTPDGALVYVLTMYARTVSVIDTAARRVAAAISVPAAATNLVMAPNGTRVYVGATECSDTGCEARVFAIDTVSNAIIATVALPTVDQIETLVASPDGRLLYASSPPSIWIIDATTNAVAGKISVGRYDYLVALTPDGTKAYVMGEGGVRGVDLTTGTIGNSLGIYGWSAAFTAAGTAAYVTNGEVVYIVDVPGNTVIDDVAVDYSAGRIAIASVRNGCPDADALTPKPTRTPTDTPLPTSTATVTRTPTRTPTPRATATPTFLPVLIAAGSTTGRPGERVTADVRIRTMRHAVVAVQNDLSFPPSAPIAARPNGRPACVVNPAIDKPATGFAFQPAGCRPGIDCTRVRAIVVAVDNVTPILDGQPLYSCTLALAADATAGSYPLTVSAVTASAASGDAIAARGMAGTLVIATPAPLCPGDCNGDGATTIDEVMMCISNISIAIDLPPRCPACDADRDGEFTVNEIIAAVNAALNGCP